jgi:alkaline phosphatase
MDVNFRQPSMIPLERAAHSGEDVGVYAVGPHSHIFVGLYEQNYIAHGIMYASCLGPSEFLKADNCPRRF